MEAVPSAIDFEGTPAIGQGAEAYSDIAVEHSPAVDSGAEAHSETRAPITNDDVRWAPPHLRVEPAIVPQAAERAADPPEVLAADDAVVPARSTSPSKSRSSSVGAAIVFALLLVVAGGFGWWSWAHPLVEIRNPLLGAVDLTVPGALHQRLEAGTSIRFRGTRKTEASVSWETLLEGPSPTSHGLGQKIARRQPYNFESNPLATTQVDLRSRAAGDSYFAPLITNTSDQPLRVIVNWELSASNGAPADQECHCLVPPGATRQFIGYYRLYANSNVRAITEGNAVATFQNIGAAVDPASGRLSLKFSSTDFLVP